MRLLILTHDPGKASFRVRWARHLPALAAAGFEASVARIPGGWRGRAAVLEGARGYELVVLQRRLLRAGDFARLRRASRRLVYDFDDALCWRERPPHRSRGRARRFFRTVAGSDLVLAGSRLLAGLARLRARDVRVVPSAVDLERYVPAPKLAEPTAVWIGQRATLPYLEPVIDAVRAAGYRLRVIADAFPEGVEAVPWSEADEARRLAECHVGLMPLPSDPWARGKCGYKLLQYYAAGLPAVVSPVGAGRALADGGALLARRPEEWTDALRALRADPGRAEALGRRGRAFVAARYDAAVVGARLVRLLSATMSRSE